jgi:hypothetical protein
MGSVWVRLPPGLAEQCLNLIAARHVSGADSGGASGPRSMARQTLQKTQNLDRLSGKKLFTGGQGRVIFPESWS